MRAYAAAGLLLIVLGCLALCVRTITYFSHDQVIGPLGFFAWDVSQPHTIFINPVAGMIAIGLGVVLIAMSRRPAAL